MFEIHKKYMRRCFDLARLAAGRTSPNPLVGAVLVLQNRIIGEGFHRRYGQPHAEVEAVRSVATSDRPLIPKATLYVSLEPCSVFGRTPPCTDLILKEKIKKVVISHLDHSPGVNGLGIRQLREKGVQVIEGVLSETGGLLSRPRNTFVTQKRPYIILKYACTANGFIAYPDGQVLWLSNSYSKRLVHKWRSEMDAIMVGTNTALHDNPKLTTRLFPGPSPIRVIPDRQLRLPPHLHIFDDSIPTLIFTQKEVPFQSWQHTECIQIEKEDFFQGILQELFARNIQTLFLEGGKQLLEAAIAANLWDEARVFVTPHQIKEGLGRPFLAPKPSKQFSLLEDRLEVYYNH